MSGIYISAANKSSGKTTAAIGICAALTAQGKTIQPFKKGPDYIDPMWLSAATQRPCYNLDFNVQSDKEILFTVAEQAESADLNLVEGNKGLFDGIDLHGADSNAALAKLLNYPVLLVIDAQGITRGIAPLLNGYQFFDSDIRYVGVVLNNVAGSRHESKLLEVIRAYTDFDVLGVIHRNADLEIRERHMGLITDKENTQAETVIAQIRDVFESSMDLEKIECHPVSVNTSKSAVAAIVPSNKAQSIRVGLAQDAVFCFYYQDDLDALKRQGAEIIAFSLLDDSQLPEVDGLLIGGGFPETHCAKLSENTSMIKAIRNYVDSGKPLYAECGGLMYLARQIRWQGRSFDMVGVIPGDVEMTNKPVGRGLVKLRPNGQHPWGRDWIEEAENKTINAHEFHYSRLINLDETIDYAYHVARGWGIDGQCDGLAIGNVLASYSHLRNTRSTPWVKSFLKTVRMNKYES